MNRTIKVLKLIKYIIMLIVGLLLGSILEIVAPKYRNVWLISERGNDARDNGYVFFKYIKKTHPEINAFYVINKDSADFNKVDKLGSIVILGSLLHYSLIAVAQVKISTHDMGYTPDMVIYHWINKLNLIPGKKVLLQHGVMVDDIEWYHKSQCNVDLFITSAQKERNYIIEHFAQPVNIVKLLGLCRYDELNDVQSKNQILLMPTWRKYLTNKSNLYFEKSGYFKSFQELLEAEELIELLEREDYTLVFYPHIEMQRYINIFQTKSQRIRIASFDTDDVQTLLKESKILITDFSSVFFDMFYMNRDIIFYHFDRMTFEKEHYKKGWVEYSQFGQVANSKNEVILFVEKSIKNKDKDMKSEFFKYHDTKNCERTFCEINKITENKKKKRKQLL